MPKTGKLPYTEDARDLKLSTYLTAAPPAPEGDFGHYEIPEAFGMLGNDRVGDCVFAGAGHETMILGAEGGHHPTFTDKSILSDYSAVTGYVEGDESTDRGTEVRQAMKYRKATGILDAKGKRHHIGAYLQIDTGDLDKLLQAVYAFGCVGIGVEFPGSAMDQFNAGEPWDVVKGARPEGGHYIPVVGRKGDNLIVVTWGKTQEVTPAFWSKYTDEQWAFVSASVLDADGESPEGLDAAALRAALELLGA